MVTTLIFKSLTVMVSTVQHILTLLCVILLFVIYSCSSILECVGKSFDVKSHDSDACTSNKQTETHSANLLTCASDAEANEQLDDFFTDDDDLYDDYDDKGDDDDQYRSTSFTEQSTQTCSSKDDYALTTVSCRFRYPCKTGFS